jgi:hypothetical protein
MGYKWATDLLYTGIHSTGKRRENGAGKRVKNGYTGSGERQTQKQYRGAAGGFRGMIAAVIFRALADLEKNSVAIKTSPAVKDKAMAWINGPDCETYCLVLDMDYTAVRERAVALYQRFLEKAEGSKRPRTQ